MYNFPYIFVARPGIYGSSGVHNGARKRLESLLMSEALNKIKQRHQILNYVLVGHSGGGHIVSALLSKGQIYYVLSQVQPLHHQKYWQKHWGRHLIQDYLKL